MTAQQLKNSILQMAVQGKLVPQDPNDEPASVLLERIRAEKEEMIKEGKIKKERNPSVIFRGADNLFYEKVGDQEPVCIADELPFKIPESWEWVTLKQVAVTALGKTLNKSENTGKYYPYLCAINIYWDGVDLTTVKKARFEESELEKYRLERGDLLVCEGGDIGRSTVWNLDEEMYYQNALHRIRFYGGVLPEYFKLLLECYKGNGILDRYSKGETIKHLVQSAINSIYFPLPPIEEQQRIIKGMEIIIPYIKKYGITEVELSTINTAFPDKLKRSILQMAVQGKLVPQDSNDKPASVLLEKIRAEKEQLIQAGKIKRDKHESVIYRRNGSYYEKVDGIERCIDDEVPFEIPESWEWVRFINLVNYTLGKTPPRKESEYWIPPEYPWVSIADLVAGGTVTTTAEKVSQYAFDHTFRGALSPAGTLLMSFKLTVGKVSVLKIPAFHNEAIISIYPIVDNDNIINDYLFYTMPLLSQLGKTKSAIKGNTLNAKSIDTLFVPVPPLGEQFRIIERLSSLLMIIDNIKAG